MYVVRDWIVPTKIYVYINKYKQFFHEVEKIISIFAEHSATQQLLPCFFSPFLAIHLSFA